MQVLINQLSEHSDVDEFTNFLVYQSMRSTITLINQNNFDMQHYGIEYLEWLLMNTQRFLKLNINQIQPLVTSSLRLLVKNQLSTNEKSISLLNILNKLSNQNIDCKINNSKENTLHENITAFLTLYNENADITQILQCLKIKVSVII